MMNNLRQTIAWWQIVCALLGIAVFLASWLDILPNGRIWVEGIGQVNFVAGLFFFAFAVAAGRGLLLDQRWAIISCISIQLIQAISFAFLNGPQMNISAGPAIDATIGSAALEANVGFHSSFFLGTLVQGPAWKVTINLLALTWAWMLWRLLRNRRGALLPQANPADRLPSPGAL